MIFIVWQGIDTDLHGTPAFLQGASVDPDHDKHIDKELEQKCIQTNISGETKLELSIKVFPSKTNISYFVRLSSNVEILI